MWCGEGYIKGMLYVWRMNIGLGLELGLGLAGTSFMYKSSVNFERSDLCRFLADCHVLRRIGKAISWSF